MTAGGSGPWGSGPWGSGGAASGGGASGGAASDGGAARRAAEEAVRLLQTLSEVGGTHDGPECRICPICQLLAALRQVRPEAVENLIDAAARFTLALRDLTVPAPSSSEPSAAAASAPTSAPTRAASPWPSGGEPDAGAQGRDRPRLQRIEVTD